MKRGDVICYRDEVNDDFAGNDIKAVRIPKDFPFVPKGFLWRIGEFIAYYLIAIPIVWVICCVFSGFSFKNRKAVRRLSKEHKKGFFLYANHTHWLDAFVAPLVCFPKKAHVLVSPDTVSIKGLRTFVQMLGAIPVPTDRDAIPPFVAAIEERIGQGRPVMIFPEAHIWPYCGFIRNFKPGSFRYPVKENVPSVAVCTTYTRRKGLFSFLKSPKRNVFVSEPFFPDSSLPAPLAKQKLRDEVFAQLSETAKEHTDYFYVTYEKKEDEPSSPLEDKSSV